LDTGLFLDERKVRATIRKMAQGRDVLNLFAYTCAASVYAAAGGARSTTNVDASGTYLEWGARNMALNGFMGREHRFVREDAMRFVEKDSKKYGLVYIGAPTFARSKSVHGDWDVQRDHARLIEIAGRMLVPGGDLLFTTNLSTFALDKQRLSGLHVAEITRSTIPNDFDRDSPPHRAFRIMLSRPLRGAH
jgi:23S rRNA (guanine2445-N2)-methyltransferase / 23S rRNA (guanine2069-N7)-methyltransferase